MGTDVAVEHRTRYRFDRPTRLGPHLIRLRPAPHCRTDVTRYSLTVGPGEHRLSWQQDPYGNFVARVVFDEARTELDISVGLVARLEPVNPFDFFLEPSAETFPFSYDPELQVELAPYLRKAPATPLFADYLARVDRSERAGLDLGRHPCDQGVDVHHGPDTAGPGHDQLAERLDGLGARRVESPERYDSSSLMTAFMTSAG